MYWAIAFVIALAVPQVNSLGGIIAAACVLQVLYSLPPLMYLDFLIKKGSFKVARNPIQRQDGRFVSRVA